MKKFLIFLLFTILHVSLSGQSIRGMLTDKDNVAISDAQILNLNNGTHTHSDEQGQFTIQPVKKGDTLRITHIAFRKRDVIIESTQMSLNIFLQENSWSLDEIVIDRGISALHIFTDIDIQINPVNSSQDILKQIPGLFIGQHAGGGKAEQIFLRGYDLDHGTDIAVSVDGMPVNMVSHAHGQGYADLHFVIPETVDRVDFGKGPYYANQGDFNTAGYADFRTKQHLQKSSVKLEAGRFDTYRLLGMFNLLNNDSHKSYLATEYLATDGPFESPQNFNRINVFGKYSGAVTDRDYVGVLASHFYSKWDASGQIPQRAVDSGMITRFGAIDDTEGGSTSRTNLLISYDKLFGEQSYLKNKVYLINYDFELYSNFTFFLEDPINGDQIRQRENRSIYGFKSEYGRTFSRNQLEGNWQGGIGLRHDRISDSELSHTINRKETLDQIQLGTINQTNARAYANLNVNLGRWTLNPSLSMDYFDFQYNDDLQETYQTQSESKAILSPKLNVLYDHSPELQIYAKFGKGFHSNDTRVVLAKEGEKILPAAYGMDWGLIWKPAPRLFLNAAYWYMYSEQEFVYVGDAGIIEPSGRSKRQGIDLSVRFQPWSWLFWNFDANYSHARAIDEEEGSDYIPLAPDFTLATGLHVKNGDGLYGGLDLRHINDRPANEDYTITAIGYTVVDMNVGYIWKNYDFGIQVQNLFNTEWNETQFATLSRLQYESEPVEEIHFTPGTPFFIKAVFAFYF